MNYCSACGAVVTLAVPRGDDRPRHVCGQCGEIHYQNPRLIAGCIPIWEDKVLLCRRAIEPRHGFWTLPAGFMENGETTQEAAARETLEEATARVEVGELFSVIDIPYINQVYMLFTGRLVDTRFSPGGESLEVALLAEPEIPWERIAFPSIQKTLRWYFDDLKTGSLRTHTGAIRSRPRDKR
jgi:ADP-ribose pyrophosphatase YjhB (NUDIX family)